VPERGFGALGAPGPPVTRRRRKLGGLAWDHGHGVSTGTGPPQSCDVQGELLCGAKRTDLRPGASENVPALRRPLGHPRAAHVPRGDSELQQAWRLLQRLGQQLHRCMLWLVRRTDPHLAGDWTIAIPRTVLREAIEGFRAACAARAQVCILDREAPGRRDVLRDTPPPRPAVRVWGGLRRDHLGEGLHNLCERRGWGRQGVVLLPPVLPARPLLQDQTPRPRAGLPPSRSRAAARPRGSPAPAASACPSRSARPRPGRQRDHRPATASRGPTALRPLARGRQAPGESCGPACADSRRRGSHGGARADTQNMSGSCGCGRLCSVLPRSTQRAGATE
jgi:hypothetical protein